MHFSALFSTMTFRCRGWNFLRVASSDCSCKVVCCFPTSKRVVEECLAFFLSVTLCFATLAVKVALETLLLQITGSRRWGCFPFYGKTEMGYFWTVKRKLSPKMTANGDIERQKCSTENGIGGNLMEIWTGCRTAPPPHAPTESISASYSTLWILGVSTGRVSWERMRVRRDHCPLDRCGNSLLVASKRKDVF